MYNANIKSKKMTEGNLCVVVEYVSTTDSFTETYDMRTAFNLEQRIETRLSELNELATSLDKLKLGAWAKKEVIVTPPTPQQMKQMEYSDKLSELTAMKRELDLGIVSQVDYDIVLNKVKGLKAKL